MDLFVQPELKIPQKNQQGNLEWQKNDAVHPFWVIKRQSSVEEDWNAELVFRSVTQVLAGDSQDLGNDAFTDTFTITLPCITNTKEIKAGQNVILKHEVTKKPEKVKRGLTWVDSIAEENRKRFKVGLQGKGSGPVQPGTG